MSGEERREGATRRSLRRPFISSPGDNFVAKPSRTIDPATLVMIGEITSRIRRIDRKNAEEVCDDGEDSPLRHLELIEAQLQEMDKQFQWSIKLKE